MGGVPERWLLLHTLTSAAPPCAPPPQTALAAPSGADALQRAEELPPLPPSPDAPRPHLSSVSSSLMGGAGGEDPLPPLPDLPPAAAAAEELDLGAVWGGDGGAPF